MAEFFCLLLLKSTGQHKNFLFQPIQEPDTGIKHLNHYNKLDPLLGWTVSKDQFEEQGFIEQHHAVLLQSDTSKCSDYISVYISGGSTTDLFYDKQNWPFYFFKLMDEKYCVKVYVSAIAGYNSGQEFLKLIRDVSSVNPDFHISYSGANEIGTTGYVSYFERNLYNQLSEVQHASILPNLTYFFNRYVFNQHPLEVQHEVELSKVEFWENNMHKMQAIAKQYNYEFIGVLQPVLGFGSEIPKNMNKELPFYHHLEDYQLFYPDAIVVAESYSYIYDFTGIFHHLDYNVFKDDCHLIDEQYQQLIADSVFFILEDFMVFSDFSDK